MKKIVIALVGLVLIVVLAVFTFRYLNKGSVTFSINGDITAVVSLFGESVFEEDAVVDKSNFKNKKTFRLNEGSYVFRFTTNSEDISERTMVKYVFIESGTSQDLSLAFKNISPVSTLETSKVIRSPQTLNSDIYYIKDSLIVKNNLETLETSYIPSSYPASLIKNTSDTYANIEYVAQAPIKKHSLCVVNGVLFGHLSSNNIHGIYKIVEDKLELQNSVFIFQSESPGINSGRQIVSLFDDEVVCTQRGYVFSGLLGYESPNGISLLPNTETSINQTIRRSPELNGFPDYNKISTNKTSYLLYRDIDGYPLNDDHEEVADATLDEPDEDTSFYLSVNGEEFLDIDFEQFVESALLLPDNSVVGALQSGGILYYDVSENSIRYLNSTEGNNISILAAIETGFFYRNNEVLWFYSIDDDTSTMVSEKGNIESENVFIDTKDSVFYFVNSFNKGGIQKDELLYIDYQDL